MTTSVEPLPATSFQILRRLVFDHGRRYGIAYLAALVFMGVGSAATALVAYLLKPVLNHMVEQDGLRNMRVLSGAVAMLFAVRGVCSYFSQVLLARAGARITANMQLRLFDRLLDQDIAWLRDGHSSAMLARLAIATGSIRDTFQVAALSVGRDGMTLFCLIVVPVSIMGLIGSLVGAKVVVDRTKCSATWQQGALGMGIGAKDVVPFANIDHLEVTVEGEQYLILRESDVLAVIN